MEQKPAFWRSAMTYGLILGIISSAYSFIMNYAGKSSSMAYTPIIVIVMVACIVYFQFRYRNKKSGGLIKYSTALGFGTAMSLFVGITSMICFLILTSVDPAFLENIRIANEDALLQQGMPDEQIEMMSGIMSAIYTPSVVAVIVLFGAVLQGFVISLITSIFVQKAPVPVSVAQGETRKEQSAFDRAMRDIEDNE